MYRVPQSQKLFFENAIVFNKCYPIKVFVIHLQNYTLKISSNVCYIFNQLLHFTCKLIRQPDFGNTAVTLCFSQKRIKLPNKFLKSTIEYSNF